MDTPHRPHPLAVLLPVCALVLGWSAIKPFDYKDWFFEIILGVLALAILTATYRRFPFSTMVYVLVGIHFAVLCAGGKYTYAENPWFDWLRDVWLKPAFGLDRNYFDRVGHFMQGFVPAIVARELLLRTTPLRPGKMLGFLCVAICLAASAFYEMIEWWTVIFFYPDQGEQWLGTQGDVWDAQWDMFMCMLGATLSTLLLRRWHDRSMARLPLREEMAEKLAA